MLKMGVAGSKGRMGQAIFQTLDEDSTAKCTVSIDRFVNAVECLKSSDIDVLIDFSQTEAALNHLQLCCQYNIPMVLGVTGFSEGEKALIQKASEKIPVVFSPNFSLGVNLAFQLLSMAADSLKTLRKMGIEVEVAVQEMHHKHKKDKPSGTALRMGEIISAKEYASSRIGDVAGEHSVIFALEGERLEITHRAQNRIIFAKGAVTAAKWLVSAKPGVGLYDMQDVLKHG